MKIAVIQNKWLENVEKNFDHVKELTIALLKKEKIDFILLPEFFLGPPWFQPGQAHLKGITDDVIPGRISGEFCCIAKQFGVNIVMGTIIENISDKFQNVSLFINSKGEIAGKSTKLHLFAGESIACQAGNEIEVYNSDLCNIGIAVCSDFWIIEVMKILSLKGANIIFIPGGTLGQNINPMIAALKCSAYLTSSIIVYASPIGRVSGKRGGKIIEINYSGSSLIASPEKILACGSTENEEILTVDIPDNYLTVYRENKYNEIWQKTINQRQYAFKEIMQEYEGKNRDLKAEMQNRMSNDYTAKINCKEQVR